MMWILTIIVFLFGLSIGSFLNVCIYRLPRGSSIVRPRSFCPSCGVPIAWYDNIPLLSYLLLRGRCRHCDTPISPRYPLVELFTGIIFAAVYLYIIDRRLDPLAIPFYWYFVSSLIALSMIDWEHQIIPDVISYPLLGAGLILSVLRPEFCGNSLLAGRILPHSSLLARSLLGSGLGILAGGGALWLIGLLGKIVFRKEALGRGDVNLMAAVGAWLGAGLTLLSIFLGAFLGAVVGLILIARRQAELGSKIPFGPYLAAGTVLSLFFGADLLRWYAQFWIR